MNREEGSTRPRVCRRLFQDEEDNTTGEQPQRNVETARLDNVYNQFMEALQEARNEAREKWNFDFESETPLEGQWEWEKVEAEEREQAVGREREVQTAEMKNAEEGTKTV